MSDQERLEIVRLRTSDQASAEIYLNGGHVTSWITSDGRERLFLSRNAVFRAGSAIRGGVPVVFPQFSEMGSLPKHGFARVSTWLDIGAHENGPGAGKAHLRLVPNSDTRQVWEHEFILDLLVTVGDMELGMSLQVTNTDHRIFSFTACFHTYLRVQEIADVVIEGLGGLRYTEFDGDNTQAESDLRIRGEVDRQYWNAPGPVRVHDGRHTLTILREGFPDVVVWNPGPKVGAAIDDLEPEGYRRMLCVEPAAIGEPVQLEPGETWRGVQTLLAR